MALINLRNALMAGKRLPYDAEVEYLESTGTQWIDTGLQLTSTDRVDCRFALTRISGSPERINGQTGIDLRFSFGKAGSNKNFYAGLGNLNYWTTLPLDTDLHDISLDAPSRTVTIDRQSWPVAWTTFAVPSGSAGWSLFARTAIPSGDISTYAMERVCWAKIYRSGVLVRDFIPVRKGTVGYMYDRVSGKLFGNAGTGDFVLGQDVVPVEWLEGGQLNGGIAFIDTGYSPNSSTKIESTSAIFSSWGYSGRFGDSSRLTFGAGDGRLYLAQGVHYYFDSFTVGTFYSFVNDIANRTVSVEGVGSMSTSTVSNWYPQLYPVYLFASNVAPNSGPDVNGKKLDTNSLGRIRMKSCNIWENDIPVRNYIPVRVGTGSTWEGAMIDTLTRRIYRNAGTAAFEYGNDLKYPIPSE